LAGKARRMWVAGLLVLVLLAVAGAPGVAGTFACSLQTGQSTYETVQCNTYCVTAYYKNTAIPAFLGIGKICSAVGCANLTASGEFDLPNNYVRGLPSDGEVVIYGCTPDDFSKNPKALETTSGSCNEYRSFTQPTCTAFPESSVKLRYQTTASFWALNFWNVVITLSVLLSLCGCGLCYWRCRKGSVSLEELEELPHNGGVLASPALSKQASGMSSSAGSAMGRADSFLSYDAEAPASPGPMRKAPTPTPTPTLMHLDSKFSPGSAAFERAHVELKRIYKEEGMPEEKADGVIAHFAALPDGLAKLNERLESKYGKHIEV
jgi:hypothetical protein